MPTQSTPPPIPIRVYTVVLTCWRGPNPRGGIVPVDRWSLVFEDKTIITRETEFEARAYAKEMGWRIERAV